MKTHDLMAYVDHQLSAAEEARVEKALLEDPQASHQLAVLLRQRLLLAEVMQAGEEAAPGAAPRDLVTAGTSAVEDPDVFMRALQERDQDGSLDPLTRQALQVILRDDLKAAGVSAQLPSDQKSLLRLPTANGTARTSIGSSSRRLALRPVDQGAPTGLPPKTWIAAAAVFLVSVLVGSLWWDLQLPESAKRKLKSEPTSPREVDRAGAPSRHLPRPRPMPPEFQKDIDSQNGGTVPEAPLTDAQRRERERLQERLPKSIRGLLRKELPRRNPNRAVHPGPEDKDDPVVTPPVRPEAVAEVREPVPLGKVLFVQPKAKETIVVRVAKGAETRTPLTSGAVLWAGDRLETQRLGERPCATVRLDGGATVDLSGGTTVQLHGANQIRLECGRIYASFRPPTKETDEYDDSPSFVMETAPGRYVAEDAQVEVSVSPDRLKTSAKIACGRVRLLNNKGCAVGVRGQELRAQVHQAPIRNRVLTAHIWRGRDLPFENLPCGHANSVVVINQDPLKNLVEEYALALAHGGTRRVVGLSTTFKGNADYSELARYVQTLKGRGLRNPPKILKGNSELLQAPQSGHVEDTRPVVSPAVSYLVSLARRTRPERPVVVVCAGALTEVASAWLKERSCATNLILVFCHADTFKCADVDPWAARIVLPRFRCVAVARQRFAVLDPGTFDHPRDPLWRDLSRKGMYDAGLLATVTVPGVAAEVARSAYSPDGMGGFRFVPKPDGAIWLVKKTNDEALRREMEQTFFTP